MARLPAPGAFHRMTADPSVIVRIEPGEPDEETVLVRLYDRGKVNWDGTELGRLPPPTPDEIVPCPVDALDVEPCMCTMKGWPMSARMERIWRYIRRDRKLPLTDFSTDMHVEMNMVGLQCARGVLVNWRDDVTRKGPVVPGKPETYPTTWLTDMIADIERIMARTPAARVPARSSR